MSSESVDPVSLLQELIRFRTVNPPGAERACVEFLARYLGEHGVPSATYSSNGERPNLVARIPGRGLAPPLLLYGHVDVVPVDGQAWSVPPFEGLIQDGFVWGRGALDMKGGVAMMVAAFLACVKEQAPGDVILAILSDEEGGGELGARFLSDAHPGLFEGVRHAIGEFGAFTLKLGSMTFFPIQVAEKSCSMVKITITGQGGHGSIPPHASTIHKAAAFIAAMQRRPLPIHITTPARLTLRSIADSLSPVRRLLFRMLTYKPLGPLALRLLGKRARLFEPLIRSTVTPTGIHASSPGNVVPEEVTITCDVRLLPGQTMSEVVAHLKALETNIRIEFSYEEPRQMEPDFSQLGVFQDVLRDLEPKGRVVPMLLPGSTDARHFLKLGIQTYGFLPMTLPDDLNYLALIHAADERIPVESVRAGTRAIERFVRAYSG